jgi:hypothetical protein
LAWFLLSSAGQNQDQAHNERKEQNEIKSQAVGSPGSVSDLAMLPDKGQGIRFAALFAFVGIISGHWRR